MLQEFNLKPLEASAIGSLSTYIRHIRAAEYMCAGITFELGDFTARAMATNNGRLEDLYALAPDYHWGRFDNKPFTQAMVKSTVAAYLDDSQSYDIYLSVSDSKLKRITSMDEF